MCTGSSKEGQRINNNTGIPRSEKKINSYKLCQGSRMDSALDLGMEGSWF
jgi:hypothetical protein